MRWLDDVNFVFLIKESVVIDFCVEDFVIIYVKFSLCVIVKVWFVIDVYVKKFIEMLLFCVFVILGGDGSVDVLLCGGGIGFVCVDGFNWLLMFDRVGNNWIDSFCNVVEGLGFV